MAAEPTEPAPVEADDEPRLRLVGPDVDGDGRRTLLDAALETEFETGRREGSVEQAKRHILLRLANIVGGVLVVIVGLAMMVLPGPGIAVTLIGLALLAPEVPFADRLLKNLRARLPQDEDGSVSKPLIVFSVACFVLFTGASIWWGFFRPE